MLPVQSILHRSRFLFLVLAWALFAGCNDHSATTSNEEIRSEFSRIDYESCRETIDENDPNDTVIRICPGVLGYSLILRRASAGRPSIDVRTPATGNFPLDLDSVVTRSMFELYPIVEWRVTQVEEELLPLAIIIQVDAHESEEEPELVTQSYIAFGKITTEEICLTDLEILSEISDSARRAQADSAVERKCLESLR